MPGNHSFRGDLGKRHDHKRALMHAWMRDGQSRLVQRKVAVKHNVEIQGARRVGKIAHPPMAQFNREQSFEQVTRLQAGFNLRHGIDEIRLIAIANRRTAIQGRTADEMRLRQTREFADTRLDLQFGLVEIGAQRDE